jgi:hypothetical protein
MNDDIQIEIDPEFAEPSARIEHEEVDGELDFNIGTDEMHYAENNTNQS